MNTFELTPDGPPCMPYPWRLAPGDVALGDVAPGDVALGDVALKALRVSESRYRRLFETARDAILHWSPWSIGAQ